MELKDIKLNKQKVDINDSSIITGVELASVIMENYNIELGITRRNLLSELSNTIREEGINSLTKDDIDSQLTVDNIYELKKPVNISGIINEGEIKKTGIIYYNPIMDKLRINTNHGWKSVKLE